MKAYQETSNGEHVADNGHTDSIMFVFRTGSGYENERNRMLPSLLICLTVRASGRLMTTSGPPGITVFGP